MVNRHQERLKKSYPIVLIIGSTGAGKTAFADELTKHLPAHIINGDMGQMYTPLSIGTAKPLWRTQQVPHHCFDIFDEPLSYDAYAYREEIATLTKTIRDQEELPIIVGGSTFYIYSLIFAQIEQKASFVLPGVPISDSIEPQEYWNMLHAIDPARAEAIHPHDIYRLKRALALWFNSGVLPSTRQPTYCPLGPMVIVHLLYDRSQLISRLRSRVHQMLDEGWCHEVFNLLETPWESFWQKKKIIGYSQVADYIRKGKPSGAYEDLVNSIVCATTAYAKKQETYWRMLARKIANVDSAASSTVFPVHYYPIDLTFLAPDLYIKQLLDLVLFLQAGQPL